MVNNKIIMLVGGGVSSKIMYNKLRKEFNIEKIIIEDPISRKRLIKGRIKRLGLIQVFGQLMFQFSIRPIISIISKSRISQIIKENDLDISDIPFNIVTNVSSINSRESINIIRAIEPKVIVVNGTRIISNKVLSSTNAKFINTHVGITPKYRGVHGAYWALANNDKENCGVTVHLIDEGIDTGDILYQKSISFNKNDNFVTYPLIQTSVGAQLMSRAIKDTLNNNIKPYFTNLESKLWHHPTILEYLWNLIIRGIK